MNTKLDASIRRTFSAPAETESPGILRRRVCSFLASRGLPCSGETFDAAACAISELCTNVVRHAAHATKSITVTVIVDTALVSIGVHDGDPYVPTAAMSDPDATCGRGLPLVDAYAASLGGCTFAERTPDGGKTMWALLPIEPES
ncbi:ATP-binding protein [Streptomyces sp. FZ201]|uniref:ATP-binding protein n=1 Tax=Streptomyces sp. FZ201 TaxID=3057122 RepID=UPI0021C02BF4|nr:ATP-binding protein [Streptomyces sp. FZ201]